MAMLQEFHFEPDYNKAYDNIAESFYLPCMRSSSRYDRISGYFSSSIYVIAWAAMKCFIDNNGHIRLICSPYLSDEDRQALDEGYSRRNEAIIEEALIKEITEMFTSSYLDAPSKALACLVANGIVDVKIAIPSTDGNPDIGRLFHDKIGIFSDVYGNSVGFRGPMNETFKGLSSDGNLESIDVFPSWEDERDKIRLEKAQQYFEEMWNQALDGVCVYSFPQAAAEIIHEKANGQDLAIIIDEIAADMSVADKWKADKSASAKKPRKHQYEALESWVKNGRRGIFEHATGSGKTYTAICAIRNCLEKHYSVIVLVPSIDLLTQWQKEMKDNISGLDISYLFCGGENSYWHQDGVLYSWTQESKTTYKVIISTMDTASSDFFLRNVAQGEHLLLVADEVHRLGSPKRKQIFNMYSGARLGLSATPRRYGDPEGTKAIMDYFGGIVPPVFSLLDAIQADVLTKYFYYPITLALSRAEQDAWDKLTVEINKLIAREINPDGGIKDALKSPRIQMKLIARARILKNATAKPDLAIRVISANFKKGQRWIIYCDNQAQLTSVLSLLLHNGYDAYEYHSDMEGDRIQTLSYFSVNGGILVSIRCLDEGIDIPSTTHALILASSKNPREFIQRRGRILRKYPGKYFAYLYDAIVTPCSTHDENDRSVSIIEAELARAIQFGEWAENYACITDLKNIAVDNGIKLSDVVNGGIEDGEE